MKLSPRPISRRVSKMNLCRTESKAPLKSMHPRRPDTFFFLACSRTLFSRRCPSCMSFPETYASCSSPITSLHTSFSLSANTLDHNLASIFKRDMGRQPLIVSRSFPFFSMRRTMHCRCESENFCFSHPSFKDFITSPDISAQKAL